MTSISQYLNLERVDTTEPASFYLPGIQDWAQLKGDLNSGRWHVRNGRNSATEKLYPAADFQGEIDDGDGSTTS